MASNPMDAWLHHLKTVVDSLNLVDPQWLPPSFSRDVLQPVKDQPGMIDHLIAEHRVGAFLTDLAEVSRGAEHRTWYFWEEVTRKLGRLTSAQACFVFEAGSGNDLSKVHPLESEEDSADHQWPRGENGDLVVLSEGAHQQVVYWRLGGVGEATIVFKFVSEDMLPRIQTAPLEQLSQCEFLILKLIAGYLPRPAEATMTEIVGHREPEAEEEGKILGEDPGFLKALELLEQAANSDASVYLKGESGTGKELFARHLHVLSPRKKAPFVPINCSAIPHELIESEMFGHEKGAFTGAYYRKIGKAEQAHGGTLFLDEIGEMPLAFQAKLLRYLQEKKFTRVGGNQGVFSDARIVVATHRDLKDMVGQSQFREDLYYRIHVIPITIPPLRDRGRDIRFLAKKFFQKYIAKSRASRRTVDEAVFDTLEGFDFPGNVRELDNIIHRTVVMTKKPVISVEDMPEEVRSTSANRTPAPFRLHPFEKFDSFVPEDRDTLRTLKKEVEQVSMSYQRDLDRRFLLNLLHQSGGSARKAAERADINRTLFYKLLKRAGIDVSLLKKAES